MLYLNSPRVLLYFCILRQASSLIMLPSTISISYSTILRVSRSSTKTISFKWTPWNWSPLNSSTLLMNNLKNLEISSSSRWFPCMRRTGAQERHMFLLYGCLMFSSNVKQLIVWLLSRGLVKTAFLHPIGTSLSKAGNTVKFVKLSNIHIVFILFRRQDSMTPVLLKKSFFFAKSSWVHTSLGRSSRVLFSCARVRKSIWTLHLLYLSNWNRKPDSLLLHISNGWKNDQISRSRLFRWTFPLRNWIFRVAPFQVWNPPRNVDKNATLLSSCDPQHLPLCVPQSNLLFLVRSAFRVECFYVDVERKILETLDNKVYTWRWHQVLVRCAS